MLRASSYNIYINLPDSTDEMLLVHGYSGAYDKVSVDVGTFVQKLDTYDRPKPMFGKWSDEQLGKFRTSSNTDFRPSEVTIETLRKRGYLTEKTHDEEEETLAKIATNLHESNRVPAYIIMPTYNCNLRCSYCFQDHMRTDKNFSHLLKSMSIEMADKILAVMADIEKSKGWRNEIPPFRRIGFFGGEPLLKRTYPVIKHFIEKSKTLGEVSFYAVTNGTDLHHYRDLLGSDKLNYLQITLDGPPEEHDKRRIYPNGKGSFHIIAENITMALDQGVRIGLRMNIDRNNVHDLPKLAEEFVSRGWHKHANFASYAAPIHASNDKTEKATTFNSYELSLEIDRLREEFPHIMPIMSKPDDPLIEHVRTIFDKKTPPSLKSTFCGAHNEMFIFDAFGDIYACWEVTGDKKVRIGHIKEEGDIEIAENIYKVWRSRNVTTNPVCSKCKYALHCGGGCAVLAERENGTLFSNYCDAFGKRFNNAVSSVYIDFVNNREFKPGQERPCDL